MIQHRNIFCFIMFILVILVLPAAASAQDSPEPASEESSGGLPSLGDIASVAEKASQGEGGKATEWSSPIKLAMVFTLLALLPSLMVMMTSFTRIIIVLGFVRRALTTQNIPPTVAIVGLAMFLTLFTMAPTFRQINTEVVTPYLDEDIEMSFPQAADRGTDILQEFMLSQTRENDLALFVDLAELTDEQLQDELPSYVVIPAFAISEFRTAFEMGCLLFIPFLLIDIVTAGILLATGMMMLPPSMVSLPLKIILFVLVDGWRLLAETLVRSFNGGL